MSRSYRHSTASRWIKGFQLCVFESCTCLCMLSRRMPKVCAFFSGIRHSFRHKSELCMEQTEFFKVYSSLCASYSSYRHRERDRGVRVSTWWERVNLFLQCRQMLISNYSFHFCACAPLPWIILHFWYIQKASGSVQIALSKSLKAKNWKWTTENRFCEYKQMK